MKENEKISSESSESPDLNKEGLIVKKERVLIYSKLICPLDCLYCFAGKLNKRQGGRLSYLSNKQLELLKNLPENVKTIMLGCDTEFLQDEEEAIKTLKNVSRLGKDISIITKLTLTNYFIDFLQELSTEMERNDNFVVFSMSIPCFDSSTKWEPKAPRTINRIQTLQNVSRRGIHSMVAIRPLIPTLSELELNKILETTHSDVFGYYSGPLYLKDLNDAIISPEDIIKLELKVEEINPSWMPGGNTFLKIENVSLMGYLHERALAYGCNFFEGAAEGVEFLRKNHNSL